MTQRRADLIHWTNIRNAATSWAVWRFAQERIDVLFRAMGYAPSPYARLADRELVFPAVRAALEGEA